MFEDVTSMGQLGVIVGATGTAVPYQWLYQWAAADIVSASPYTVVQKPVGLTGNAVSMSELGNGAKTSYGVTVASLPAGFQPVRIPDGTPVWLVPWRMDNGVLIWVIINTQAVDGECPS